MKVAVIGAGASGLVAAIHAALGSNEVILIDRNDICGKKILITGNGRCNYFNSDMDLKHYNSSNTDKLEKIMTENNKNEILAFFEKIGIVPRIKDGYYYPNSNKAISVRDALVKECQLLNVKFKLNFLAKEIIKKDKFIIKSETEEIVADKIILALGSKAYPKTGSEGKGYDIARKFGHTVSSVYPALTGLCGNENYFKFWAKSRSEAKVSLIENDIKIKEEIGEVQFADYGVSGVCIFNLSSLVSKGLAQNKKEEISINFLPYLNASSVEDVVSYLYHRSEKVTGRTIFELLEGILDYKLINTILTKTKIDKDKYLDELSKKEIYVLAQNLFSFKMNITATKSFDHAQVCSGGVSLNEINPLTMESSIIKDLYITGELLDVDGDCGGYNLAFAFISGMIAGKASHD